MLLEYHHLVLIHKYIMLSHKRKLVYCNMASIKLDLSQTYGNRLLTTEQQIQLYFYITADRGTERDNHRVKHITWLDR